MKTDPIQLQRLVDGELDRESIHELLQTAESHSEQWREIALTFVEDQIWRSEFVDSVNGTQAVGPEQTKVVAGKSPHSPSASRRLDFWTVAQWVTLAAMLLVMFATGYFLGQPKDQPGGFEFADAAPSLLPSESGQPIDGTSMVSLRPEYHMQLQDIAGGTYANTEIPLYDFTTAQRLGYRLQPPELPEQLKQNWTSSGFQLKQNVDYISGRLDDGRRFIIPVRTINLTSGQ